MPASSELQDMNDNSGCMEGHQDLRICNECACSDFGTNSHFNWRTFTLRTGFRSVMMMTSVSIFAMKMFDHR